MNRRGFLSRIILAAGAMLLELRAAAGEIRLARHGRRQKRSVFRGAGRRRAHFGLSAISGAVSYSVSELRLRMGKAFRCFSGRGIRSRRIFSGSIDRPSRVR